jgi:hypothetical protein
MKIIDKVIHCPSRSSEFEFIPIGDVHIGARSCAEKPLKKLINGIGDNTYIIGGGDVLDLIRPQDIKRFDFDTLPDWMIEGDALNTREVLNDIVSQQYERAIEIFTPVKHKIIGFLEGNHEFSIRKYAGRAVHRGLCRRLNIEDLTDEALIRLRFKYTTQTTTVIIYIRHGYGGGRTPGAEPNRLARMLAEWEIADICFSGHSHTFDILPPKPVLEIPKKGSLLPECTCRYRWAGNWGCWLYSHPAGASSYSSRACYPARPLLTCKAVIKPFKQKRMKGVKNPIHECHVEMRSITI